jgi:flavorubredoxin
MRARTVTDGVTWVGSVDWDRATLRRTHPVADGTSYNAYLVTGSEKTALIDTVDPAKTEEWRELLDALQLSKLDYVIANHAEQDHSGSLPFILERFPGAKVICTPKAKGMLIDLLHLDEGRLVTVADGETLSLGDTTLEFIHAAWVHWPRRC